MREFTHSIDIARSPAQVWPVISDIERWPEWTRSMERIDRLDSGALGVGSRARVRQPRLLPAVFTVSQWTPERGFAWRTRSAGVEALARHSIEPTATGSRVTLSVTFSGPFSGIVSRLFGSLTERYLRMEADGLKRRVESQRS